MDHFQGLCEGKGDCERMEGNVITGRDVLPIPGFVPQLLYWLPKAADWCRTPISDDLLTSTACPYIPWTNKGRGDRGKRKCGRDEFDELDHGQMGGAESGTSLGKGAAFGTHLSSQEVGQPCFPVSWRCITVT